MILQQYMVKYLDDPSSTEETFSEADASELFENFESISITCTVM